MAQSPHSALGIYISVPFCRSKCTYCNFASGVYPASEHERYVDRLIEDMCHSGAWAAQLGVSFPRTVDTVYLGGGTPSLLEPGLIHRLFAALRAEFHLAPNAEITVECAPAQIADATLAALAECGVNRVSLGVQSFIDREAHSSGRLHNRAAVLNDLHRLRSSGIANLNIDLIAGLAGQTFASWDESLAALIDSGVPHASIYMLEVDEDSRLGREMLSGGARYHAGLVPSDDAIAHMYETAVNRLAAAGPGASLVQYEISNFSLAGHASLHNLRYWQRHPYLGLGLDASSMLLDPESGYALRSKTTDNLSAWLENTESAETACLSPDRQQEEAWFLGLRMNSGVNASALASEFGAAQLAPALQAAKRLARDGLLVIDGDNIRLTTRGRLLSNDVFQEFLSPGAEEGSEESEALSVATDEIEARH